MATLRGSALRMVAAVSGPGRTLSAEAAPAAGDTAHRPEPVPSDAVDTVMMRWPSSVAAVRSVCGLLPSVEPHCGALGGVSTVRVSMEPSALTMATVLGSVDVASAAPTPVGLL